MSEKVEIDEFDKQKMNYLYFTRGKSYDEIRIDFKDKYTYRQIKAYLNEKIKNYTGVMK